MGSADAVPGISGGTVALVIGLYRRLIGAIATVLEYPRRRDFEALRAPLAFLLPLGLGMAAAYWLVSRLLIGPEGSPGILLQDETAPLCYGLFSGLVAVSLREPWRRIEAVQREHLAFAGAGAVATFIVLGLPFATSAPAGWMLPVGGALALTAMLLPGVSGSLVLVMLGQYATIAGAVHDLRMAPLLWFGSGGLVAALVVVPRLQRLLIERPGRTLAVLTGVMAGSLRALWPWKASYDVRAGDLSPLGIGDNWPEVALAALLGGALVLALERLSRR
nr:putative membrane protein [uncultured marine group II/III euryarchaeote KM3_161_F10]